MAGRAGAMVSAVLWGALALCGQALAQDNRDSGGIVGETHSSLGAPIPWGLGLQPAGGPVKEAIHDFNTLVLWIIKEAVLKAARASCRSMRDVELSWENTREFSARIAGPSALGDGITLRHGTLRGYAVAAALYDGAA